MTLQLFGHPFSSFTQKALIAVYENDIDFTFRMLEDPATMDEFAALWPVKRFPLLLDNGHVVFEATSIIEYLQATRPGPVRLVPDGAKAGVKVRMLDRVFDLYVSGLQQKPIFDAIRPAESRDPYGVAEAKALIHTTYAWLDKELAGREWAAGDDFTLADCAAAPALFYADWTWKIPEEFATLKAYRERLLARPSFARCVEGGRPFRHYFPLGAPDQD